MCFLIVGNVDTDIAGLRQQNIRVFFLGLSAIFDLRVKVVPPYIINPPIMFPMLYNLGIECKVMYISQTHKESWPF